MTLVAPIVVCKMQEMTYFVQSQTFILLQHLLPTLALFRGESINDRYLYKKHE
jgi:hypothetical protein